jgi:hypothetical protein
VTSTREGGTQFTARLPLGRSDPTLEAAPQIAEPLRPHLTALRDAG